MYWFKPAAIATLMAAVLTDVFPVSAVEAPGLIYDTDICGDCDDVLALGMIHALQLRGACKLLAVTVSVDNDLAAPFVNAVNTFYGRGDIPIGVVGKGARSSRASISGWSSKGNTMAASVIPTACFRARMRPPRARFSARSLPPRPTSRL